MLRARNISKSFAAVKVLHDVSLTIEPGEVHALMGENGAGKSTLMRILACQLTPDSGEVKAPSSVAMIHQELMPFLDLTVAENVCIGREPAGRLPGSINRARMRESARSLLARLGSRLDPDRRMRGLSVAQMQIVEIARALGREPGVILMDEPTSALSKHETESLFAVIGDLKARGVSVVYTSHKMEEVLRIADRVTVLRDGRRIGTHPIAEVNEARLIAMMIGRELADGSLRTDEPPGDVALEVTGFTKAGMFKDIRLSARRGEIVGMAGLLGAGRTELASAIFGLVPADSGEIRVNGRVVAITGPADAIRNGIAMVTEDRKESGIVPRMSVTGNLTLAALRRFCRGPWIDRRAENGIATDQMRALGVRCSRPQQPLVELSGGNQQKVMIARALLTDPQILILDEPTRGIDIGAKAEVYEIIRRLACEGKSILMISSELPEILALSDRVLVMREGEITAELDARRTTQEEILRFAAPN